MWVIESVFLRSPNKGFWACQGDLPRNIPRGPETWVSLCNLMLKLRGILHSSAILQPTPAPALMLKESQRMEVAMILRSVSKKRDINE